MRRPFAQVDVFGEGAYRGNPLAVVLDGTSMTGREMQLVARWTNLSETVFLLPPVDPAADYLARIFTPAGELPFAGHPTLGAAHAFRRWAPGASARPVLVQECGVGLVHVREAGGRLAFVAPPLARYEPVEEGEVAEVARQLAIDRGAILDAQWVDNGPGWLAVLLADAEAVLALRPGTVDAKVGVVGFHPAGGPFAIEVRAFFPVDGATSEDPVTGSLNASVARWLLDSGRVTAPYVASQGTVLGRRGRVEVDQDASGAIWVGGTTATLIEGEIDC